MDSYAYDYGGYAAADASATATTVGVGAAAAACCFQVVFVALVVGCCFRRTASPVVRQLLGDEENPTAPVIRDQAKLESTLRRDLLQQTKELAALRDDVHKPPAFAGSDRAALKSNFKVQGEDLRKKRYDALAATLAAAEAAGITAGVDEAHEVLSKERGHRKRVAKKELEAAMADTTSKKGHLEGAIAYARDAGVKEELVQEAVRLANARAEAAATEAVV